MSIPETVTQEDLDHWREHASPGSWVLWMKSIQELTSLITQMFPRFPIVDPQELWFSGAWLASELYELGASSKQQEEIGLAHGQRCFFVRVMKTDCWELAKQSIEDFKSGTWDLPGPAFANKLDDTYMRPFVEAFKKEKLE
jgi:hypothetical protein